MIGFHGLYIFIAGYQDRGFVEEFYLFARHLRQRDDGNYM